MASWLFPRMAAVVHHGGSGTTTGAALAAGRPQVICPFGADQPFWARGRRGAATPTTAPPDAAGLADAIRQAVTDRHMAERAEQLGMRPPDTAFAAEDQAPTNSHPILIISRRSPSQRYPSWWRKAMGQPVRHGADPVEHDVQHPMPTPVPSHRFADATQAKMISAAAHLRHTSMENGD